MGGLHRQTLEAPPDMVALGQSFPQDFPFLLESSARSALGRYSMLLLADSENDALVAGDGYLEPAEFVARLKERFQRERVIPDGSDLDIPFRGGWFLYLGYEMAGAFEPVLDLPKNPTRFPDALACRCRGAIISFHDKAQQRSEIIAEDARTAGRINELLAQFAQRARTATVNKNTDSFGDTREGDAAQFIAGVHRIHEYLLAGDVFQVNLSRRWDTALHAPAEPMDIYRSLREANPAPFSGVVQWNGLAVLSSSPERLVELRGGVIQTRPIAGTRPRHADPERDRALSRELIDNVKERAEHIMLIDLERNDLGRVCEPGSVEVNELMVIESYAHVHHIVSNVRGKLRRDADPVDALAAVFPGGTITGCPKVRCMEIIAELEKEGRGCYTGSMGYLCRDGDLDMNILIRSMLLDGRQLTFRTGAGIVADSVPEKELDETTDKARGLLIAIRG